MDEFALIRRFFDRPIDDARIRLGIGDDAALIDPEPGRELVCAVDTIVAGTHYPLDLPPFDVGYRSVAINLSDIAAMGGRPRWMTLALTLPAAKKDWVARFAEGLHAAAGEHDVTLVGGDTTLGKSLVVSVQITGDVAAGKAIRRSAAQVGDEIYVTGTVGDAAAGLELLAAGDSDNYLSSRFLRPVARVAYGQRLIDVATAAIDLSDGLFADLAKLLTASGVGGNLELDSLPLSNELRALFDSDEQRNLALSGGDDYELCFTMRPGGAPPEAEFPVTRIGTVTDGEQLICRLHGELVPYTDSGYRHFQ